MSLASQLEKVSKKLAKYQGKIEQARDDGRYTREIDKVESAIARIWKLQRKARNVVKKLPATERRLDVAKSFAELVKSGEAASKSLMDFRAELLQANVSAALPSSPRPPAAAAPAKA